MLEADQRCRVAPKLSHSLGSSWLVSKVFQRFSITERKKQTKTQNTRKPKSDLVQALEHLWH